MKFRKKKPTPADRQMAAVDRRTDGEYVVMTYSLANAWVLDGPITRLPPDSTAHELGTATLAALARCRAGLPQLSRDSKPAQPLLEEFGLTSWGKYMKNVRSVTIMRETGGQIDVTPKQNDGPRGGFTSISEHRIDVTDPTPDAVGHAILDAFRPHPIKTEHRFRSPNSPQQSDPLARVKGDLR